MQATKGTHASTILGSADTGYSHVDYLVVPLKYQKGAVVKWAFIYNRMARESQSGGGSQELITKVAVLEQTVNGLETALAGKLGIEKVTQSMAVTEAGYVADARQLNATLPGSFAHSMASAQEALSSRAAGLENTVEMYTGLGDLLFSEGYKDIESCRVSNLSPGFYLVYSHTWVSHYQYAVESTLYLNGSLLCVTTFPGSSDNRFWCRVVGVSACTVTSTEDILRANTKIGLPEGESVKGSCTITAIRMKK